MTTPISHPETQVLRYRVQLYEAELHELQRQQQSLIRALEITRARLDASEGRVEIFDQLAADLG